MHVFFLGYPGTMGGANTEAWHTTKVWRAHGIDVTFLPAWSADRTMQARLAAIGCPTLHPGNAQGLRTVPGITGSIVVAMCCQPALTALPILRELHCRFVWINCMTFLFDQERAAFRANGPADAYVFQSEFQKDELERQLMPLGYNHAMGHLIRGALAFDEIPFNPKPHEANEDFWIGRLARPDLDKWSANHWPILSRVPYAQRRAVAMGWHTGLDRKCGPRPPWAETFAPQQIPADSFLGRCHAMLGLNGGARENWPRIGLEAMAAGVPLVCQNQWGWKEMLLDGQTGFLTNSDEEMAFRLAQLAYDESLRCQIIQNASEQVRELACPERIGRQWARLFESLGN